MIEAINKNSLHLKNNGIFSHGNPIELNSKKNSFKIPYKYTSKLVDNNTKADLSKVL